jgi:sec1 family domain-containing protein 1
VDAAPKPVAAKGAGKKEVVYKILVMDSHCTSILSPVLHMNDLRRHGITLHLDIDRPWYVVPDMSAIYLVCLTPENADRIAADAAAGLYASFFLNLSTSLLRPLLECLTATCSVSQATTQRVAWVIDGDL